MGAVYRVIDKEREAEVALKVLTDIDPERIAMLKAEFRSLSDIVHDNLVSLYELVSDEDQWFFTMELIDGVDFLSWVRPHSGDPDSAGNQTFGAFDLTQDFASGADDFASWDSEGDMGLSAEGLMRLREALPQLVDGIMAIHRAGKQHRDLKPGNVLVTPEGRVVILDFGLVAGDGVGDVHADPLKRLSAGTPAYMPPETFLGKPSSNARDYFALGVMLYQALTGRLPYFNASVFQSPTPVPPPAPSELVDVPADLESLCMELLTWDPARRPSGPEILARLGVQRSYSQSGEDPTESVFVGREKELRLLRRALQQHEDGQGVRVWVEGRSGLGKSALVHHFLTDLYGRDDVLVLAGRCHERESVAYKVFDTIIDTLAGVLLDGPVEDVAEFLPEDIALLARIFPVLRRVPGVQARVAEDRVPVEPAVMAQRGARALRALLARIAQTRRLVIYVDDLQWGDKDSARLLSELFRGNEPVPALFIAAYRSEDVGNNEVLTGLLQAAGQAAGGRTSLATLDSEAALEHHIVLAPLSEEEARSLAQSLLSSRGDDVLSRMEEMVDEAGGSPFFVEELARYMRAEPQSKRIQLEDALRRRISGLNHAARSLLEAVCVIGRPVPLMLVIRAAGVTFETSSLVALRNAHMVRTGGIRMEDRIEPYHDRIRETVVADLESGRQQSLHRRVAEALENEDPKDTESLAEHWDHAGDAEKAAHYLIESGNQAAAAFAFDRAVDLYKRALSLSAEIDRAAVAEALGNALRDAGRGPEAAARYLELAGHVQGHDRLDLRRRAFEQLLISGHVDEGMRVASDVLRDVGVPSLPESGTGVVATLLYERFRLWLRGTRFTPRADALTDGQRAWVDTCWAMATGLSIVDSKLGAIFTTRFLRAALDSGDKALVARGLAFEAAHQSTSGAMATAEELLSRAATLAEESPDAHTEAFVHLMRGFVHYFQGRWTDALAAYDRANDILKERCVGVNWELSSSIQFANWSLLYAGDWHELFRRGPQQLVDAEERGNRYLAYAARVSYGIVSRLVVDDAAGARRELTEATEQWSSRGFQVQHFLYLYMGGWIELYEGTPRVTYDRILAQWPAIRRALMLQIGDIRLRLHHMRGYTAVASGADAESLRDAERCAAVVAKVESRGSDAVAAAIRAGVAHRQGRTDEALRALEHATERFDAAEMPVFSAACRYVLGRQLNDADLHDRGRIALSERGFLDPEKGARIFVPGFDQPS